VLAVPHICRFYPGICLTTEEKAQENLSQGSRRVPAGTLEIHKHTIRIQRHNKNTLITVIVYISFARRLRHNFTMLCAHLLPLVYNVNSSSERYELFYLSKSWHHSTVTPVVAVDRDEQGCCGLCLPVIPKHPCKENFQPSIQTTKGRKG
jgi:hypothetical protein